MARSESDGSAAPSVESTCTAKPSPPPSTASSVQTDLYCIRCEYNLRTLPVDSVCPECSCPVLLSVSSDAEADWLKRVGRGLTLMYASAVGLSLVALFWTAVSMLDIQVSFAFYQPLYIVTLLIGACLVVGIFKATKWSLYHPRSGLRLLRTVARIACVAALFVAVGQERLPVWVPPSASLYYQVAALLRVLDLLQEWLVATYLFLLLSAWGFRFRKLWMGILALTGLLFISSVASLHFKYGSANAPGGMSALELWTERLLFASYVGANVTCVIFFRACRQGVARILSARAAKTQQDSLPF